LWILPINSLESACHVFTPGHSVCFIATQRLSHAYKDVNKDPPIANSQMVSCISTSEKEVQA